MRLSNLILLDLARYVQSSLNCYVIKRDSAEHELHRTCMALSDSSFWKKQFLNPLEMAKNSI